MDHRGRCPRPGLLDPSPAGAGPFRRRRLTDLAGARSDPAGSRPRPHAGTAGTSWQATGRTDEPVVLTSLPPGGDGCGEARHVVDTLGRPWLSGVAVAWESFHAAERRSRYRCRPTR